MKAQISLAAAKLDEIVEESCEAFVVTMDL